MDWGSLLAPAAGRVSAAVQTPAGLAVVVVAVALVVVTKGRVLIPVGRWLVGLPLRDLEWGPTWLADCPDLPPGRRGGPATRWGRRAGWKRMRARWFALMVLALLVAFPRVVAATLIAIVVVGALVWVRRTYRRLLVRRVVVPFEELVCRHLGWGQVPTTEWITLPRVRWRVSPRLVAPAGVSQWGARLVTRPVVGRVLARLRVPSGIVSAGWASVVAVVNRLLVVVRVPHPSVPLTDRDAQVVVRYPHNANVGQVERATAAEVLTTRLRGGEWEVQWDDAQQRGTLRHPATPPGFVEYTPADTAGYRVDQIPIGKNKHDKWTPLPLADLTPHVAMSATTGWCKTSTLQVYVAHALSRGGRVLILDPKRKGFRKAFGNVPGVAIATSVEAQARFLAAFVAEMEWRYDMLERFPELDEDDAEILAQYFTPWFLVIDEKATLTQDFKAWWKTEGGKGMAQPLQDEKRILNLGRAAGMYLFNVSQQANLDVFVDSNNRDNHMARIAAGPQTRSSWMMMFPGEKMKKVASKKGRAILGIGLNDLEEIQLAFVSTWRAREIALTGVDLRNRNETEQARRLERVTGLSMPELERPVPDLPGAGPTWHLVPEVSPGPEDAEQVDATGPVGEVVELVPRTRQAKPEVLELPPGPASQPAAESAPAAVATADPVGGEDEWLYGQAEAAEFLGYTKEQFIKARHRHKKTTGRPIPGEVKKGPQDVRFRKSDLREWHSQRPLAGRKAA